LRTASANNVATHACGICGGQEGAASSECGCRGSMRWTSNPSQGVSRHGSRPRRSSRQIDLTPWPAVGGRIVCAVQGEDLLGVVRFAGEASFASGQWLGVELDKPSGKNDGSVMGQRYFQCPPSHGLFVRPCMVKCLMPSDAPAVAPKDLREQRPMSPPPHAERPASLPPRTDRKTADGPAIGSRVVFECAGDALVGVVAYVGEVWGFSGTCLGIRLDMAVGNSNGSVCGKRYFECPPRHGIFVRPKMVLQVEARATIRGVAAASRKASCATWDIRRPRDGIPLQPYPVSSGADGSGTDAAFCPQLGAMISFKKDSLEIIGFVKYVGTTSFAKGLWIGVACKEPQGKHDGSVDGERYFDCAPAHGLFIRPDKVTRFISRRSGCGILPVVEERVVLKCKGLAGREGTVAFVGQPHFASHVFLGIVLDEPLVNGDGIVDGRKYFTCPPFHGIFVRPHMVVRAKAHPCKLSSLRKGDVQLMTQKASVTDREGIAAVTEIGGVLQAQSPAACGGVDATMVARNLDAAGDRHVLLGQTENPSKVDLDALDLEPSKTFASFDGLAGGSTDNSGARSTSSNTGGFDSVYRSDEEAADDSDDDTIQQPPAACEDTSLKDLSAKVPTNDSSPVAFSEDVPAAKGLPQAILPEIGASIQFLVGSKEMSGVVKFAGETEFASGLWIGVALEKPIGKNNGTIGSVNYFDCPPLHGLFVKPDKVLRERFPPFPSDDSTSQARAAQEQSYSNADGSTLGAGERVLLDEPSSGNDDSIDGRKYFDCPALQGGPVQPDMAQELQEDEECELWEPDLHDRMLFDGDCTQQPQMSTLRVLLAEDERVDDALADQRSSSDANRGSSTASIFISAVAGAVPPQAAMHPTRVAGAMKVLTSLRGMARESVLDRLGVNAGDPDPTEYSDEVDIVKRLFLDSMPAKFITIWNIKRVVNPHLFRRFLARVAEDRASVEATFHGTRTECTESILRDGFLTSTSSTAAYGFGVYVGTHAGVAHQYADPDVAQRRHICLVLVVVGGRVVQGKSQRTARMTAVDNSVNPTQYCFVDEDRLLVSHLIEYSTLPGIRKRVGGGWEDPFARALNHAVQRAGKTRRSNGLR